jgi:phage terminase large subunit-like protein
MLFNPDWDTSCKDWESRIMAGASLVPKFDLFQEEAARALRIFKKLKLPDVIGTPTMAKASGEWFFPIVEALFGSYDPEANRRMIQEYFILVPKKNGKSSYSAAIMVVAMIVNRRPNAEYLLIAPTKEIAGIAFKQAAGIINADVELKKLFHAQGHIRTLTHRKTGATLQIKAADTDVITGSKSTGILVDETHEFAKKSNANDIFIEIRGALAARPDGFMIQISTQSKQEPSGVFKSELGNARAVRDGRMKLPLLAIIYELPEKVAADNGWREPKTWGLVNPNIGRSVDETFLANQIIAADEDKSKLAMLASQHWNVQIGLGLRTDRWVGADFWQNNVDRALLKLETVIRRSEVIVVGGDGGGLDDLLAIGVLGRDRYTKEWLFWTHAWAHRIVLERRKEIAPRLLDFQKDGDLTIVETPGKDVQQFADIVEKLDRSGKLATEHAIGVDAVGIGAIVAELTSEARRIDLDRIIAISQGWKLSGAIKDTERYLAGGELLHGGSPMMAWAVGNAKVEPRGNAITITKQAAGTAKIDPLMALFDCVAIMTTNPEAAGGRARAMIL